MFHALKPLDSFLAPRPRANTFFRSLAIAVIASVAFCAQEATAEELTLTREVILEKGDVPEAKTIVRTYDNGLIIAGTNESKRLDKPSQGWAIKTDAEGNLKWRHVISRTDKPVYGDPSFSQGPTYNSAVVMPDDSVFLCGEMPLRSGGAGLLTHLDKDGTISSSQTLFPENNKEKYRIGGRFLSCATLNNEVIAVGTTATFPPSLPDPSVTIYYWVAAFDSAGTIKWEKIVPVSNKMGNVDSISPIYMAADGSFVFVAERNSIRTEIVHFEANGEMLGKKLLDHPFIVAQPANAEKGLHLISMTNPLGRVTLNDNLEEIEHVDGKPWQGPSIIKAAFQLPDKSLMFFGSILGEGKFSRVQFPGVMRLDLARQSAQSLNLSPLRQSYWVDAAVPLNKPGEFVCARQVFEPAKSTPFPQTQSEITEDLIRAGKIQGAVRPAKPKTLNDQMPEQPNPGIALDFITLR